MNWFFKILFDKKLQAKERAYRLKLIKDNESLIQEVRKLKSMMKGITKQKLEGNGFLASLHNSNFDQLIFVLELGNKTINFLWVKPNCVELLRKFNEYTRVSLNHVINLAGLVNPDFYGNHVSGSKSIFTPLRQQIDLSKIDFSMEKFETKLVK